MRKHNSSDEWFQERFWGRIRQGTNVECWPWTAPSKDKDGYGLIAVDGRLRRAHRVAYQLAFGAIPPGNVVMHCCDNPACCNPEHLKTGTVAENNADRSRKGRGNPLRGEAVKTAKRTAQEVREVRERYAAGGETIYSLAAAYGAAPQDVHEIIRGKIWRDAGGPIQTRREHLGAKLVDDQIRAIRKRYSAGGVSQRALAVEFGVCTSYVNALVNRRTSR